MQHWLRTYEMLKIHNRPPRREKGWGQGSRLSLGRIRVPTNIVCITTRTPMIMRMVGTLHVTPNEQVSGMREGMIHLQQIGPHLSMISNLGVRKLLPVRGMYLLVCGESKMWKSPGKGANSVEIVRFKMRLQQMRWIPYLEAFMCATKHKTHKRIMPERWNTLNWQAT